MNSTKSISIHTSVPKRPDWAYRILLALAGVVAGWLLIMPVCPPIIRSTMDRFHLRSNSFAWWAVQTPIPAMYNFKNTSEVRDLPPGEQLGGLIDPILLSPLDEVEAPLGILSKRVLNHYPAREFTFANGRVRHLQGDATRWLVIESFYQGESMRSAYQLERDDSGGWRMARIEDTSEVQP